MLIGFESRNPKLLVVHLAGMHWTKIDTMSIGQKLQFFVHPKRVGQGLKVDLLSVQKT